MDKEELIYNYRQGYHNADDLLDIPDGAMIAPSSGVLYNRRGLPVSQKDSSGVAIKGGNIVFPLDANTLGLMGATNGDEATGNMFQGTGKNLWFVGNTLIDGVRVLQNFTTLLQIGGTNQIETLTLTGNCTGDGTIAVVVFGTYVSGSPVLVTVSGITNGDTPSVYGAKILAALQANAAVTAQYWVYQSGASIIFLDKFTRANDLKLKILITTDKVTVSGAGSTAMNDVYYHAGTSSGKAFFIRRVNFAGDFNAAGLSVAWATGSGHWEIWDDLGNIYYYANSAAASPAGLTFVSAFGINPVPAVTATTIGTATGINIVSSANTTAGAVDYAANLSSIPQIAKWNGTFWENPTQVGLAPQEVSPELILTTDATRDAFLNGIITGSTSVRSARKRGGLISIASPPSNVVTGDTDSVYVTIPAYTEDGSLMSDRTVILYFTYRGKGSLLSHFMFPIEIPETKLNGMELSGWESAQGNARIKVISQHPTDQSLRKIEVEFYDNDLLTLEPYDDYFSADACKFIIPLGNTTCLLGTGIDATGFDVSFPNFREAFSPIWRDWFAEVPISVAASPEFGIFWVLTSNNAYQAEWTGAMQDTAPIVLQQVTSKYGVIGPRASVTANGVLYYISNQGIPVRISADREIDIEFGSIVKNYFTSTLNSDTSFCMYDGVTNSVLFGNGQTSIAWQIDSELWSAPQTLSPHTAADNPISCGFTLANKGYFTSYDDDAVDFKILSYNTASSDFNWLMVSSFQTGKEGLSLKDIIESKIVTQGVSAPYTIEVKAYKDYVTSVSDSLYTVTPTTIEVTASKRQLLERLDYESIAIGCLGTHGGDTVHAVFIEVDNHAIERE